MSHDDAFLASIIEAPDDDTPRLIYADWLEERDDPRGEFIRVQCELARLRKSKDGPRRAALKARGRELFSGQQDAWVEALVRQFDRVPWLAHLGQPAPHDDEVYRIRDWGEWPGLEDQLVYGWYTFPRRCHDRLLDWAGPLRQDMKGVQEAIRDAVVSRAKQNVPLFNPDQMDVRHGPTFSVWDVSLLAGLFAAHLLLKREMPPALTRAWSWVVAGHWPCGYVRRPRPGRGRMLMVY
jgi:uncharacterized protein (TIGR02996 family)